MADCTVPAQCDGLVSPTGLCLVDLLLGTLSSDHGDHAGKRVYAVPIDGPSDISHTEAACVQHNLRWVTIRASITPGRDTIDTLGTGGCSSGDTQKVIMHEFCGGDCDANNGDDRCMNLATWVSDEWQSGAACINPVGGTWCAQNQAKILGMRAVCIER